MPHRIVKGGIIGFLPGIISAANSNKAHKKRVKADRARKDNLRKEFGSQYNDDDLITMDEMRKSHAKTKHEEKLFAHATKGMEGEGRVKKRRKSKK